MSTKDVEKLQSVLAKRLKNFECPICHSTEMIPVSDFVINNLGDDATSGALLVAPTLPSTAIVCSYCGFIMQYAVSVLKKDNQDE